MSDGLDIRDGWTGADTHKQRITELESALAASEETLKAYRRTLAETFADLAACETKLAEAQEVLDTAIFALPRPEFAGVETLRSFACCYRDWYVSRLEPLIAARESTETGEGK